MDVSCVFSGTMVSAMDHPIESISAGSKAVTAPTRQSTTPRVRARPDRTTAQPPPAGLRVLNRRWSKWHTFLLGSVVIPTLRHS